MNSRTFLAAIFGTLMMFAGWRAYGWAGLAIVITGLVTWMLLHVSRMIHVLKKASQRPTGYVGSAVMLNAKLKAKVNLLHVMALTNSLGERLTAEDEQPEIFRWRDEGGSSVTCEFANGKLVKWTLDRPVEVPAQTEAPAP